MKKGRKILALLAAVVMTSAFSAVSVSAEEGAQAPAPMTSKQVFDKGDGTFDVSVTVEGRVDTDTEISVGNASDIVLVVDRSGSMDGEYWTELVNAIDVFTDEVLEYGTTNRVALVSYATFAEVSVFDGSTWTSSKDDVMNAMAQMEPWGLTNVADAIDAAADQLADSSAASKNVVVFSDGYPDSENQATQSMAALKSAFPEAEVYSVGVSGCDEDFMKSLVADEANYFYAENADELSALFGDIAVSINKAYSNVVVTETINEYADVIGEVSFGQYDIATGRSSAWLTTSTPLAETPEYNAETKTFTWNVNDGQELASGTAYVMTYTVKASDAAIAEYGKTGYPSVGDENTDADSENITSSGKKGFDFSDGVMSFNYGDVSDVTAELANPVIQVPKGTEAPTSPKTGTDFASAASAGQMALILLVPAAAFVAVKAVRKAK